MGSNVKCRRIEKGNVWASRCCGLLFALRGLWGCNPPVQHRRIHRGWNLRGPNWFLNQWLWGEMPHKVSARMQEIKRCTIIDHDETTPDAVLTLHEVIRQLFQPKQIRSKLSDFRAMTVQLYEVGNFRVNISSFKVRPALKTGNIWPEVDISTFGSSERTTIWFLLILIFDIGAERHDWAWNETRSGTNGPPEHVRAHTQTR